MSSYNAIPQLYTRSDEKPDKLYSIRYTILQLIGEVRDKVVLDAGCGSGFFTREFVAQAAKKVYGWDVCIEQIKLARQKHPESKRLKYERKDIFDDELHWAHIFNLPFVLNYAHRADDLYWLMERLANHLILNGKIVGTLEQPSEQDLSRYGARKRITGPYEDGSPIEITIFDDEGEICTLPPIAYYYRPEILEDAARQAGLRITWHDAMIDPEGIKRYGAEFWEGYIENPELLYFTAQKS